MRCGERCGCENQPITSGDIGAQSNRQPHSHSLWGFAPEQSEAGGSRKHQNLWRPAQVVSGQSVGRSKTPVMEWHITDSIEASGVAAPNIQAATSPAFRIAHAKRRLGTLRAAGRENGKPKQQSPSCEGLPGRMSTPKVHERFSHRHRIGCWRNRRERE